VLLEWLPVRYPDGVEEPVLLEEHQELRDRERGVSSEAAVSEVVLVPFDYRLKQLPPPV
jgi:hypothetical protein